MPNNNLLHAGNTGNCCDNLLTNSGDNGWPYTVAVSALLLAYYCYPSFLVKCFASIAFLLFYLLHTLQSLTPVSFTQQNLPVMTQTTPERLPQRLVIFPYDVTAIHSCSKSTAGRKLKEAREYHQKQDHQLLTIAEYCNYFDLDYNEIITFLKLWK